MNANVYAAPKANLEVPATEGRFYVVSKSKFWMLYIVTAGFYVLVWFYRHFRALGEKRAALKTIFSIFFVHQLARRLGEQARQAEPTFDDSLGKWSTLFIVVSVLGGLVGQFVPGAYLLVVPINAYSLWRLQRAANVAAKDEGGAGNRSFTLANYFWIVVGFLYWALVLLGFLAIWTHRR